jgi:hypothetical protein
MYSFFRMAAIFGRSSRFLRPTFLRDFAVAFFFWEKSRVCMPWNGRGSCCAAAAGMNWRSSCVRGSSAACIAGRAWAPHLCTAVRSICWLQSVEAFPA